MIVKKSMLNTHKKYMDTWPFNVDEVAVTRINIGGEPAFSICHKYRVYALSGVLEGHGFAPLETAGIWADHNGSKINFGDTAHKKSLSPFFEFCEWQSGRMG
jgi:hypothetical protein